MGKINREIVVQKVRKGEVRDVVLMLTLFSQEKRRDFPWRKRQTAYRVLVSELMLQQTQVSRVAEKYEPFLKQFPSLAAVRNAPLSELLLAWKGLGYMRRIKALKEIGMQVTTLPRDKEKLMQLPGIGDYTAGAVLAFAHNVFTPIVETNIKTVLCHHFCLQDEPQCFSERGYKKMLPLLFQGTKLSARHFYEAMMDYGSDLKKHKVSVCKTGVKQKAFKGSRREQRAKLLYLITEKKELGIINEKQKELLEELESEHFIVRTPRGYEIAP